ncbi:LacI family DNA-binding transcriptional regulator [Pseudarthrobacter sp. P1]|uniref:LacI family DNA-binding transcriptional regulator n=1 Tax=Pseudarthrobacter sp. P1 TaxID=3418418 RepID=UPI003CF2C7CD
MAKSRPTIDDIASKAGVSRGAVSFALNGRPGVSEATRARIIEVARQLDWSPNSAARALSGAKTDVIGLVIARPAKTLSVEPFFSMLISGIQAGLSAAKVALQMQIVEDSAAEIATYRRWWNENRVDGVILIDLMESDPRIPVLEELSMPAVVAGGPGEHGHLASVWADDRAAMVSVVDYLAAIGHRRIGHISGLPGFQHTQQRLGALADSAQRLGLPAIESVPTDFSDSAGAAATRHLLSRQERPTAIIYDNDVMALAGLGIATEMNISVPRELSIVSFDDSALTKLTNPAITSLTGDTFNFGHQVSKALLRIIADPTATASLQLPTPVLSVRASTAPPLPAAV